MENVVLWGCGNVGRSAYDNLKNKYQIVAWGDNNTFLQGTIYKKLCVLSPEKLYKEYKNVKVIICLADYYLVAQRLAEQGINVVGYYDKEQNKVLPWKKADWNLIRSKAVRLYAGDIYEDYDKYPDDLVYCLSLINSDYRTIQHDITTPYPLVDNSVESYQIEDVLEHIEFEKCIDVINEIYRILIPNGYLRLSLPDYYSPRLINNSFVTSKGKLVYDPLGGGNFINGKVCDGGHVWFPTYDVVIEVLEKSHFSKWKFYRYHDKNGKLYSKEIPYELGYIRRTQEHLSHGEEISIVVDCWK